MTWETNRLLLRPLVLEDLEPLYQLYGQVIVMRYITGQPRSYEKTQERLRHHIDDFERYGFGLYATILKATGEFIGRCGLEPVEGERGLAGDIAWMLTPAWWGQGLATEFAQAMIPYGFTHFPLTRIFATADHRNPASIRIMQKVGMRLVRSDERGVEYAIDPPSL